MPKAVFRPVTPFVAWDPDGVKRRFGPDTLVPEGHWVVKGREHLLEPAEDAAERVEQATSGPGESRAVSHPCPVEGCDYSGSKRGLKIHTGQVHG